MDLIDWIRINQINLMRLVRRFFSKSNTSKIKITAEEITFEFFGNRKSPDKGDIITVSEAEAIFLTLKNWSEVCRHNLAKFYKIQYNLRSFKG